MEFNSELFEPFFLLSLVELNCLNTNQKEQKLLQKTLQKSSSGLFSKSTHNQIVSTFAPVSQSLPRTQIEAIELCGPHLFIGTNEGNLFHYSLSLMTETKKDSEESRQVFLQDTRNKINYL